MNRPPAENFEGEEEKELIMQEAVRLAEERGANSNRATMLPEETTRRLSVDEYLRGQIHGNNRKKIDDVIVAIRKQLNVTEKELLRAMWIELAHVVSQPESAPSREGHGIDSSRQLTHGPEDDRKIVYTLPTIRDVLMRLLGAERILSGEARKETTT